MQPSFQFDPKRVATPTIRGFVYQVDLTIEDWLGLPNDFQLHLECGEDIDQVALNVRDRLVTQVKDEAATVTLRSPSAVTAIANFLVHQERNPNVNVRFRFCSTAKMGKEKMKNVPEKGIILWRKAVASSIAQEKTASVGFVRRILKNASRPSKYPKKDWDIFTKFWKDASEAQLLEVMRGLDWVCQSPASSEMQSRLQQRIIALGHANEDSASRDIYQRLFVFVFKLLCQDGPKILTFTKLNEVLKRPLSEQDKQFYIDCVFRFESIETNISDLQQRQKATETFNQETLGKFDFLSNALEGNEDLKARLRSAVTLPSIETPKSVDKLSLRRESVNQLMDDFGACSWLALSGGVGWGKTQLSILITQRFDVPQSTRSEESQSGVLWLSLRDCDSKQAQTLIERAIEGYLETPSALSRALWLDQFFEKIGADSLLVLDDLPRMDAFDGLAALLVDLSLAASRSQTKLLSTSNYDLPFEIGERLDGNIEEKSCPPLSVPEVREVLLAYGAPTTTLTQNWMEFITAQVSGHPLLLNHCARFLAKQDWRLNAEFEALLKFDFADSLGDQIVHRLLNSIEEQQHELLRRLNTTIGAFTLQQTQLLATVAPAVLRPREQLIALTGLWVQKTTANKFQVSPLVKILGEEDLPFDVRRGCHLALAKHGLSKGTLNQNDIRDCVVHFSQAKEWNEAGKILAVSLVQLDRELATSGKNSFDDGGLLSFWAGMPLPTGMSLHWRLLLRAQQITLRHRQRIDVSYEVQDLIDLLEAVSPTEMASDVWAVAAALVTTFSTVAELDFALYCRLVSISLLHIDGQLISPDGVAFSLPEGASLESFLWIEISRIRSHADLDNWFVAIESLSKPTLQRAFDNDLYDFSCYELGKRLWILELEKPEERRDWPRVVAQLRDFAERAFSMGSRLLGATFIRTVVTLKGEQMLELDRALKIAEGAIERCALESTELFLDNSDEMSNAHGALFLVQETLGRAFGFSGHFDEARLWLENALSHDTDLDHVSAWNQQRLIACICLGQAVNRSSKPDVKKAVNWAQRAVDIAQSANDLYERERGRAWAELGVAHWLAGDMLECFHATHQAALCLFACKSDEMEWKDAFVVLGHVVGYLATLAESNRPPDYAPDGSEYGAPFQTIFLNVNALRAALYEPKRELLFYYQMAFFAKAVGEMDKTIEWAIKGYNLAREANFDNGLVSASMFLIKHFLCEGRRDDALVLSRHRAWYSVIRPQLDSLDFASFVPALVQPLPSPDAEQAARIERFTAVLWFVPALFDAANSATKNGEFDTSNSVAVSMGEDLNQLCLEQFARCNDEIWMDLSEIVKSIFIKQMGYEPMVKRGNTFVQEDVLRALFYFGATLQQDAPLPYSMTGQLRILPSLEEWSKPVEGVFEDVITPFFFSFWRRMVARSLKSISTLPIEAGVKDAEKQPRHQGIRQLFTMLSLVMNMGGSTEDRAWLVRED